MKTEPMRYWRRLSLTCSVILLVSLVGAAQAAVQFRVIHDFTGKSDDGANPAGTLYFDNQAGKYFGTTQNGGNNGLGTVFEFARYGDFFKTLHSFRGGGNDGANPKGGVVAVGADLYGTTSAGGDTERGFKLGRGTVYRVGPNGTESVIYKFRGVGSDGYTPESELAVDANGDLFGTTSAGGKFGSGGTIFKVTKAGQETVLHSFNVANSGEGYLPTGAPTIHNGFLFGVCRQGGEGDFLGQTWGMVYKISLQGTEFARVASFSPYRGGFPLGRPAINAAGNLFTTTSINGGPFAGGSWGSGTLLQIDPSGNVSTLRIFATYDGARPAAGVVLDASGYVYGTTELGGHKGFGVVYRMKPGVANSYELLYTFNGTDGKYPRAALAIDTNLRMLFGSTFEGGRYEKGVIFRIQL